MTLYDKVSKLCMERGVGLYKLSRDIGVKYQVIGNWKIRENAEPSLKVAVAIADYFGIDVRYLLND